MPEAWVAFDAESHSADAIQRAAYKYADRFSIELTRDGDQYRCKVVFAERVDDEIVAAFRSEVLDQVLRERIREETAGVRNLVLALAFSNSGLSESPIEPLGD